MSKLSLAQKYKEVHEKVMSDLEEMQKEIESDFLMCFFNAIGSPA